MYTISYIYPPTPVLFELLHLKYYTIYFLLQHKKLHVKLYFFEIETIIDRPLRSRTVQFLEPTSTYPFLKSSTQSKSPDGSYKNPRVLELRIVEPIREGSN